MYFRSVHAIQYFTQIRCECDQDFRPFASHTHESYRRLRIRLCFGSEDHVDSIGLSVPSGGSESTVSTAGRRSHRYLHIVAISAALTVVHSAQGQHCRRSSTESHAYTSMVASRGMLGNICSLELEENQAKIKGASAGLDELRCVFCSKVMVNDVVKLLSMELRANRMLWGSA